MQIPTRAFRLAIIVGLVLAASVSRAGQIGGPTNLATVKAFLLAALPDLRGRDHKVTVSVNGDLDTDWSDLSLGSVIVREAETPAALGKGVVSGRFWLVGSRIRQFRFESAGIASDLAVPTATAVRKKKGWTAADMTDAFARAGAAYIWLSADEFLRVADLERFAAMLGRILAAKAVLIADLPDLPGTDTVEFVPRWLVNLETTSDPGTRWCYDLEFEPFHARLLNVEERNCGR